MLKTFSKILEYRVIAWIVEVIVGTGTILNVFIRGRIIRWVDGVESIVSEIDNLFGRLLDKGFDKLEEYRRTIAGSLIRIFLRKVQRWVVVDVFHGEENLPDVQRYNSRTAKGILKVLDARMELAHTIRRCVAGKWPHEVLFEIFNQERNTKNTESKYERIINNKVATPTPGSDMIEINRREPS